MRTCTTMNFRSPVLAELPPHGTLLRLPDGSEGWIAGPGKEPGKLVLIRRGETRNESSEVWPSELRGAMEAA